jgi:hypothetical protein
VDLPVRILDGAPIDPRDGRPAPILLVDGAFDAPGLNLSHWPGHRTPAHLRHDLSTGSALAFASLARAEQQRLAAGCVALANNHYDTDGACALFAVRHPERALPRAAALLAAARAGDFFQVPSLDAFRIDAIVSRLDEPGSPLADEIRGLAAGERRQRMTEHLLEHLDALCDGDLAPYAALWAEPVERLLRDRDALEHATLAEDAALDLCVLAGGAAFAPGRHAFHGRTARDRVLLFGAEAGGTTARLVFSTLSWFDLASERRLPRPDLEALCARLDALEGTAPADADAWRAQSAAGPAPELWFGAPGVPNYAEHNDRLAPSALPRARIETEIRAALGGA